MKYEFESLTRRNGFDDYFLKVKVIPGFFARFFLRKKEYYQVFYGSCTLWHCWPSCKTVIDRSLSLVFCEFWMYARLHKKVQQDPLNNKNGN